MFAAELVRECSNVSVVIVEPRERLGIGVAYATDCPWHVLNVPAANMSAKADDPDDFLRWLGERSERFDGSSFVPPSGTPRSRPTVSPSHSRAANDFMPTRSFSHGETAKPDGGRALRIDVAIRPRSSIRRGGPVR
jgi:hypothetical protein